MARNPRTAPARTPHRPPTTVDRIAGSGVAIPTTSGEHLLRFDLATLAVLEEAYGSIAAANATLSEIYTASVTSEAPWAAKLIEFVGHVGLDQAAIACTPLQLVALVGYAWLEAFPAPDPGKADGQ